MISNLHMKALLACCMLLAITQTYAQEWMKKYKAEKQMVFTTICPTDGGYLATGFTLTSLGERTIKLDNDGNIQWAVSNDSVNSFSSGTETTDGGLAILGFGYRDTTTMEMFYNLLRLNKNGQKLWLKPIHTYTEPGTVGNLDIDTTDDGGYICTFTAHDTTVKDNRIYVKRLDSLGNILWTKTYYDTVNSKYSFTIRNAGDGGFLLGVALNNVSNRYYELLKLNGSGDTLWSYSTGANEYFTPSVSRDGNVLVVRGLNAVNVIAKLNRQTGNEIWKKTYPVLPDNASFVGGTIEKADGNIAIISNADPSSNARYHLCIVDTLGNILMRKKIVTANLEPGRPIRSTLKTFIATPDGGYLFGGFVQIGGSDITPFLIKTDSAGAVFPNTLSGYVFGDSNEDCKRDSNEISLNQTFITFTGATDTFTVSTRDSGYYSLGLETINYNISVAPPSPYWEPVACNATSVNLPQGTDTTISYGLKAIVTSPYITISGGIDRMRVCMPAIYTAEYCNTGTAPFTGVVQLTIDTFLQVDSASLPINSQNGNQYLFTVTNLGIMECATVKIYCTVRCNVDLMGRTACIDAHAYQDTVVNPSSQWDKSNLEMQVEFNDNNDTITFIVKNKGNGGMKDPRELIVIEDNVILFKTSVQLTAGNTYYHQVKANGATWRGIIPQTDFNPYSGFATAAIEGAGVNLQGNISLGFFNQFSNNPYYGYHYTTCEEIRNSYDPNEKEVLPKGAGPDHIIDSTTTLEYTLYFQNTGNDTAYTVTLVDTLAPYLDASTIRKGASSHNCEMELNRNVLTFTFLNINLPDSGANQDGSNGYVKFTVKQKPGNKAGIVINNKAGIFFDYNPPIITNTATVRIGELLINSIENLHSNKQLTIQAYPNPFSDNTVIQIAGEYFNQLQLNVYDITGKIVKQQQAYNTNQFILDGNGLQTGTYIFEIRNNGKAVGRGKITAQ